jgi:hypothetical protein
VAQFDTLEGLRHGERGARMGFAEGDPTDAAIPAGSVFTAALVRGLRTGEADTDRDGHVSVDDAHAYVFDQIQAAGAAQTPQRWLYGVEGKILFTRNPAGPSTIPASLPESLRIGLDSPHPGIRMGAVTELGAWLTSGDPARAAAARGHLPEIASADIPRVAATARAFLDTSTAAQTASPRRPRRCTADPGTAITPGPHNIGVPDLDTLQQALNRAVERHNMAMLTPACRGPPARARHAGTSLIELAHAVVR